MRASAARARLSPSPASTRSMSFVARGRAWKATAYPPTKTASTPSRANASKRSLKSEGRSIATLDHVDLEAQLVHRANTLTRRGAHPEVEVRFGHLLEGRRDPAAPGGSPSRGAVLERVGHHGSVPSEASRSDRQMCEASPRETAQDLRREHRAGQNGRSG